MNYVAYSGRFVKNKKMLPRPNADSYGAEIFTVGTYNKDTWYIIRVFDLTYF